MKIKIPSKLWVKLNCELSSYVANKCYPIENDRTQDHFCKIVDEVESILESYFRKDN